MLELLAPSYLGWSLGANDASNVFGTAVASRMLRFATAALLGAAFVLLGALLGGEAAMKTVGGLSDLDLEGAVLASLGAALAVSLMTVLRLPVSASQAVVGAILGTGLIGGGGVDTAILSKVVVCWVGTPLGALAAAMALYVLLRPFFNRLAARPIVFDGVLRACLVVVGCYGAYALGANNAANVTGVFVGAEVLSPLAGAVLAGGSIALGMATFSRRVMMTVGRGIVRLNAYSAFIVVLSEALTVHFYAVVGVPVSTSQAVVGAVLGVGILKSAETVRLRAVAGILSGWFATPLAAALFSAALYFAVHLRVVD